MSRLADIVVGLANGDECKGAAVDRLSRKRKPDWVVRFSGGHQCAHNVVTPEGLHHCFHGFGSALLAHPDTPTYVGPDVLFDPFIAIQEQRELARKGINARLHVHPEALVVTPWHIAMNRLREISRKDNRHGSCGMGIGETRSDFLNRDPYLSVSAMEDPQLLARVIRAIRDFKIEQARELLETQGFPSRSDPMAELLLNPDYFESAVDNYMAILAGGLGETYSIADECVLKDAEYLLFEGNQGVLLDERVGFYPHVTRTDTTSRPALRLLERIGWQHETQVIGVLRAHGTRHGAGPFPGLTAENREHLIQGEHNALGPWQGSFRTGWLDIPLAKYAIEANGRKPDQLVMTCLDRLDACSAKRAVVAHRGLPRPLVPPPEDLSEPESLVKQHTQSQALLGAEVERAYFSTAEDLVRATRYWLDIQEGWETYSPRYQP